MKKTTTTTTPTTEELQAEIDRLRQDNDRMKAATDRAMTFKVSEKGALSVYGMGRFPVTLYQEQWVKLLAAKDEILAFLEANKAKLKTK